MGTVYISKTPSPYLTSDLVIAKTVTPVHAGVGRTGGIVDLPIQRDEHGYPCIYSSSFKGAFKTALLQAFLKKLKDYNIARKATQALLGPEPDEGESFESSIAFLDMYLLAMPVRSLSGVYVYITSPLLVNRFLERLELLSGTSGEEAGESSGLLELFKKTVNSKLAYDDAMCIGSNGECESLKVSSLSGKAVLAEEFFFNISPLDGELEKYVVYMRKLLNLDRPLLVVKDSVARDIVEKSVLRFTRIKLRKETKTVEKSGLWNEEYLPPKTILHSIALYKKPQLSNSFINRIVNNEENGQNGDSKYLDALKRLGILDDELIGKIESTESILDKMNLIAGAVRSTIAELINEELKGYLILGGHETIGKGIINLKLISFKDLQSMQGESYHASKD